MPLKVSVEHLHHFWGCDCGGFWSVGDFDFTPGGIIYCQKCGKTHTLPDAPLSAKDFRPEPPKPEPTSNVFRAGLLMLMGGSIGYAIAHLVGGIFGLFVGISLSQLR